MKKVLFLSVLFSILVLIAVGCGNKSNPINSSQENQGGDVDLLSCPPTDPQPCIILQKTGPETAVPGETITFQFYVENCGDTDFKSSAVVVDELLGGTIWTQDLLVGQTATFERTYTVSEEDCGYLTNTATAYGYLNDYEYVTDESSWTVEIVCEQPPVCETDLIAGQNWDAPAGVVTISDDGVNLTVTFTTTDGWTLGETNLYVSTVVPKKSAPGKFPYKDQTEYIIPLADLGVGNGDVLYIAAHAVVDKNGQQETAWADTYGTQISKGGWGMYFGYTVGDGCFQP